MDKINTAFVLDLQSFEQLNVMLESGDKFTISIDVTLGTNTCHYFFLHSCGI